MTTRGRLLRDVATVAMVASLVGAAAFVAATKLLDRYGPYLVAATSPGGMCPWRQPVYVAAHTLRDGTVLRAHCRARPNL